MLTHKIIALEALEPARHEGNNSKGHRLICKIMLNEIKEMVTLDSRLYNAM